ncbi:MAG TPA: hypothetical protein DCZ95_01085 [Verrucomicrobia bacterium]|nr:MAG: hypothetical protein A2X46_00905 [Lentisphaerae bacterium GWF2_57_35]HBA82662.1 hypothetical protein [Verrucomicrobiota bacterium]
MKAETIDMLSHSDLAILADRKAATSLSVYLPLHYGWPQVQDNKIVHKNLVNDAHAALSAYGLRAAEVDSLLAPLQTLDMRALTQTDTGNALCLFAAQDISLIRTIPIEIRHVCVVAPEFYITPLLPAITSDRAFYVLEFTQNEIKLFHGSRSDFREVTPEELPRSLAEALPYENPEESLQFHTGTGESSEPNRRAAIFHGQGGPNERQEWTDRFCLRLAERLDEHLKGAREPLVLAGVENILSRFRQHTRYPHILAAGIEGNPRDFAKGELHRKACTIMEPIFKAEEKEAAAKIMRGKGAGKTIYGLEEIFRHIAQGRVDILFIADNVQKWGRLKEDLDFPIELHDEPKPGDSELLNLATIKTLNQGGQAFAVPRSDLPAKPASLAVAILRY